MKKLLTFGLVGAAMAVALPAAASRTVSGALRYADHMPSSGPLEPASAGAYVDPAQPYKPIRFVTVTLKNGGTVLGTANTDSQGYFTKAVDETMLPAGSTLTIEFKAVDSASHVYVNLDGTNAQLTWKSSVPVTGTLTPVTANYDVTWTDFAVHFNILDTIRWGKMYADGRRSDTDDLTYVDVQYPDADWSMYNSVWEEFKLAGPHTYGKAKDEAGDYGGYPTDDHGWKDEHILHEYGHHMAEDISAISVSLWDLIDPPSHGDCDSIDYGFGWAEGFPDHLAEAVTAYAEAARPGVLNNVWSSKGPYENALCCGSAGACNVTPQMEGVVKRLLMDVHDSVGAAGDAGDRMNGEAWSAGAPIRDMVFKIFDKDMDLYMFNGTLHQDYDSDLQGFRNAFYARNVYLGSKADLDRIYYANGAGYFTLADFAVTSVSPSLSSVVTGQYVNLTLNLKNNTSQYYTDEPVRVHVYTFTPSKVMLDNFTTAQFTGTKTIVRSIQIPASMPQGSWLIWAEIDPSGLAGDLNLTGRLLEGNETNNVNPTKPAVYVYACGNGVCSAGESCSSCAADCGPCCGNGVCAPNETCATCASDCGQCGGCGDDFCTGSETAQNCPLDCYNEPGGGGSCFVAGTPITMADGSTRPIEDIAVGDTVLSFNPDTSELVPGRVAALFVHPDTEQLVTINDTLVTTVMHPFYVQGRWVRADKLGVGDVLLHADVPADGASAMSVSPAHVEQVESSAGKTTTYNFEVAGTHTYFAGGVLVHNVKND